MMSGHLGFGCGVSTRSCNQIASVICPTFRRRDTSSECDRGVFVHALALDWSNAEVEQI